MIVDPKIKSIIDGVITREGGYVNDPRDAGGETNWGITKAVARTNGWAGPMRDLPRQKAFDIYWNRYVREPKFDHIALLSAPIAAECIDTGVNMGPSWGAIFLQRSLNGLNNQGKLFADIAVDGAVGPGTLRALTSYLKVRGGEGVTVLLRAMNCLQGARYVELAEKRGANEAFLYGWLRERVA
jgi:lysozyme family protein